MALRKRKVFEEPVDSRAVVFNSLRDGGNVLFLYGSNMDIRSRAGTFRNYIGAGMEGMSLGLHAYDEATSRLNFDTVFKDHVVDGRLTLLPMRPGDDGDGGQGDLQEAMDALADKVGELSAHLASGAFSSLRIITDFGTLARGRKMDGFVEYHRWVKGLGGKLPVSSITAFAMDSVDRDACRMLLPEFDTVVVSSNPEPSLAPRVFSSFQKDAPAKTPPDRLSPEAMDTFVRRWLDVVVMGLLSKKPMCGYDLIKTIFNSYGVLLSQGRVYPLLYSMKDEGVLEVSEGASQKRLYFPTPEGRRILEARLQDHREAQRFLANSLNL